MKRLVRSTSVSVFASIILALLTLLAAPSAWAQEAGAHHGGEASLQDLVAKANGDLVDGPSAICGATAHT